VTASMSQLADQVSSWANHRAGHGDPTSSQQQEPAKARLAAADFAAVNIRKEDAR